MHSYYDNKEKRNHFSYVVLFISCIIFICSVIFTAIYNKLQDKDYVDYEVVIWNDHDVILYNTNDVTDSICLRLENSYNLADEWMIQVKY